MAQTPPDVSDGLDEQTAFISGDRPALTYGVARIAVTEPDGKRNNVTIDLPHIRVGSASENDVVINDSAVSRFHCELRHSEKGFVLRDLGSTNGTVLGGLNIREAIIEDDVVLQLGRSSFSVAPAGEKVVDASTENQFGELFGKSQAMREIFGILHKVSATDLTVTVTGETGTGKDLVARAIHGASPRAKGPFVVFDAGAVASNLIESELFGHEKGAFTGATEQRLGAFERANGGTLFLDEIGELALELQPKLLRALEQREIQRVGGSKRIPVDVRVICATNRDLPQWVKDSKFRDDLYFRISVVMLALPALRERREDIELLINALVKKVRPDMKAAPDAISVLSSHDWPGNVRELRNVIETACAMCSEQILHAKDLLFARDPSTGQAPQTEGAMSLAGKTLETIEKAAIAQTLEHCQGNRSAAARALGIAPSTLYLKLKKYDLG